MTTDPETVRGPFPRENAKHWINKTAEDVPQGWIDDMVKRLFDELNRQIERAKRASDEAETKNFKDSEDLREQASLTLARLEGTLTRLTNLEMKRASLRTVRKSTRRKSETRASILSAIMAGAQRGGTQGKTGENS